MSELPSIPSAVVGFVDMRRAFKARSSSKHTLMHAYKGRVVPFRIFDDEFSPHQSIQDLVLPFMMVKSYTFASLALACASGAMASFAPGCETAAWDSDTDYWNHKFVAPDEIQTTPFAVTYNNTFAVIRNRQSRSVVIHCTNDPPLDAFPSDTRNLFVKAPVTNVAALDGFSQNLIEVGTNKVLETGEVLTRILTAPGST